MEGKRLGGYLGWSETWPFQAGLPPRGSPPIRVCQQSGSLNLEPSTVSEPTIIKDFPPGSECSGSTQVTSQAKIATH